MKIKTNRYFFKKAEKGWAIMKRRMDGYIIVIRWVENWQEAYPAVTVFMMGASAWLVKLLNKADSGNHKH